MGMNLPELSAMLASPGSILRLDAAALADATQVVDEPASLLLRAESECRAIEPGALWHTPAQGEVTILASGPRASVDQHPAAARAERRDLGNAILLPGFVNAHCHLDLTSLGPRSFPPGADFADWIADVIRDRLQADDDIEASVERGVRLSLTGGVVAVGDIAGKPSAGHTIAPARALARSPLHGTSYTEFFAIGPRESAALDALDRFLPDYIGACTGRLRPGLSPHATNTVSPTAFLRGVELAAQHGIPIAHHLAESPAEHTLVADAAGPHRAVLEQLGLWDDVAASHFGQGKSPMQHARPLLQAANDAHLRTLIAHVNDTAPAIDTAIEMLRNCDVVYCPRASAYFRAADAFGPHRYADLLAGGINVALGTDSIINLEAESDLDPTDPACRGITPLDDARLLAQRDEADAATLLEMITTRPAEALGMPTAEATLAHGVRPLGIVTVGSHDETDSQPNITLGSVFSSGSRPRLLFIRK
ncbi:MAG: amidohydrolase family protein [Planctomycetota bacterium]